MVPRTALIAGHLIASSLLAASVGSAKEFDAGPSTSVYNAKDDALGPVLSQGQFGWCFAYNAADLVSQELGARVSAPQIALNYLANPANDDGRSMRSWRSIWALKFGGGYVDASIRQQNESGFCPASDYFNSEFQLWVENPGTDVPDRAIPPVQLDVPLYRNAFARPYLSGPSTVRDALSVLAARGASCRGVGDLIVHCDPGSEWGLHGLGISNVALSGWTRVDALDFAFLSSTAFPLDAALGDMSWAWSDPGGFERPGRSLAGGSYVIRRVYPDRVRLVYRPYWAPHGANDHPNRGPRLRRLSGQCESKLRLDKRPDQIRSAFWTRGFEQENPDVEAAVIAKVDALLDAGRILGLAYPASQSSSHVVTVVGRVCEPQRIDEALRRRQGFDLADLMDELNSRSGCLYLVRNSEDLRQRYLSRRFVTKRGNQLYWIE